ncbi:hypothetical protein IGI37_002194 [Enterococcus sp. AZ194]
MKKNKIISPISKETELYSNKLIPLDIARIISIILMKYKTNGTTKTIISISPWNIGTIETGQHFSTLHFISSVPKSKTIHLRNRLNFHEKSSY